ncbi:MAG: chitobiase/beta-hexosaminidase C-terminal domain-containing protein [Candidatus Eisenbacteria bacterium]|nr:chitobiase/beta-hexosaminidase C-terminal domain-containing protein [Candidatus Eisenbacteria bacterium]
MRIIWMLWLSLIAAAFAHPVSLEAQEAGAPRPSLQNASVPTLYLVATAHLDTQWRWTIQDVIRDYIPATLNENFALFEQYPDYVFSFEGAFRYQLIKEYYPDLYERMKEYIAAGRWKVSGSWMDAVDVNIPAPESLIRHALYGNGFFRREFGTTSRDVFLPDCFGFGYSLPAVAAHCGLLGFSTQKLEWGSAVGIPFDVGLWEGVDGSRLIATLNPGSYVSQIEADLSADTTWAGKIARQYRRSGFAVDQKFFGTGDQGGSPNESSVAWMQKSLQGPGPVRVRPASSDQLARDLSALLKTELPTGLRPDVDLGALANLPKYRGELLLTDHGSGCYTSQSAMKRWNRKNECLADAAEHAAVAAHWLRGASYPQETLNNAWTRFLWHQFHDDLTGTSIPQAYLFSWNDEAIAANQFSEVMRNSVGAVSRALDTNTRTGEPLIVYNPLAIEREDLVEAKVRFAQGSPRAVRVFDADDREVPAQSSPLPDGRTSVVFLARVPSMGFALYEMRPALGPERGESELSAGSASLENARYRVQLDQHGDILSVFDKRIEKELLSAPIRLQMIADRPTEWAAWEIDYDDLMAQPRPVGGEGARMTLVEGGPARVTLEVRREAEGSTFVQRISLAAGNAGDAVVVENDIDWRTPATLLKAAFPLTASNAMATYDLRLGTIERPRNTPKLYEVPAQQWADITNADGNYGAAILNDCRYGWDRPEDNTLRLTLLRTPEVNERWNWIRDQERQDFGRHRLAYAIYGHAGDWREGEVAWRAERMNQPLQAFQVPRHRGWLGKSFSMLDISTGGAQAAGQPSLPTVAVRALKLAEDGDEIVVRLQEIAGRGVEDCAVRFPVPLAIVREVNGAEEPMETSSEKGSVAGPVWLAGGALHCALKPYQLRSFALRTTAAARTLEPPVSEPVALPYNLDAISDQDDPTDGDFDGAGHTLVAELLPPVVYSNSVAFKLGPRARGWANAVACQGQRIALPVGTIDRLCLLAASVDGDHYGRFGIEPAYADNYEVQLWIQDWAEAVGQWDNRVLLGRVHEHPDSIAPAYTKPAAVAWVGSHRHDAAGNKMPYEQSYLFRYGIDLPHETRSIVLPNDPSIRILAITAVRNANDIATAATSLIEEPAATSVAIRAPLLTFLRETQVALSTPILGAQIRYTLDGTTPGPDSPLYAGPIALTQTTTVNARAFATGLRDDYVASARFTRQEARASVSAAGLRPGLKMRRYEGEWSKLPAFFTLTPQSEQIAETLGLPGAGGEEHFGLAFEGFLRVPREGLYTLYLTSDDGSALTLGSEKLIDNDGLHSRLVESAHVALQAGVHPIRVEYFQAEGGATLSLEWEGPGIARQPVPPSAWSHR